MRPKVDHGVCVQPCSSFLPGEKCSVKSVKHFGALVLKIFKGNALYIYIYIDITLHNDVNDYVDWLAA